MDSLDPVTFLKNFGMTDNQIESLMKKTEEFRDNMPENLNYAETMEKFTQEFGKVLEEEVKKLNLPEPSPEELYAKHYQTNKDMIQQANDSEDQNVHLVLCHCLGSEPLNIPSNVSFLTISNQHRHHFTDINLGCSQQQLTLPNIPSSVKYLILTGFKLDDFPAIPDTITDLTLQNVVFHSFSSFPKNLQMLWVEKCTLPLSLPPLPNTITNIVFTKNNLEMLPNIPISCRVCNLSDSKFTSLPPLPPTLNSLYVTGNPLSSLPSLPDSLEELHCQHTNLISLPPLPSKLQRLFADNSKITSLPPLPNALVQISCSGCILSDFPPFPPSLRSVTLPVDAYTPIASDGLTSEEFAAQLRLRYEKNPFFHIKGNPEEHYKIWREKFDKANLEKQKERNTE